MANLIVVGNAESGAQDLLHFLLNSGVAAAKPSRIQGLSPAEICAKLVSSQNIDAASRVDYAQLSPGTAWNQLALDLLAANSDAGDWAWHDAEAVSLLDFWRQADHGTRFLLVYDSPSSAVANAREATPEAAQAALACWHAYTAELLRFYNRNRENSILVHAEQALSEPARLTELLAKHFGVNLKTCAANPKRPGADPVEVSLCSLSTEQTPEAGALFDEIQATASLPLTDKAPPSTFMLLQAYREKKQALQGEDLLIAQLHNTQEELEHYYLLSEQARKDMVSLQQQAAKDSQSLRLQAAQLNKVIQERNAELAKPFGAVERVQGHLNYRVGKTVLTCSSSVIGWLCLPFALVYQVLDFKATQRKRGKTPQLPLVAYIDAKQAQRVQSYLSYRVGRAITANAGSPAGWLRMPGAIRRELRANTNQSKK